MINEYKTWRERIDSLADDLLKHGALLNQYAIWLKSSEEHTRHKGEDVYHMLIGTLLHNSNPDFIPGPGLQNLVAVVGKVQEETGLDLGVCPYLEHKIDGRMRGESGNGIDECGAAENVGVGSFVYCVPPLRRGCQYRKDKLAEKSSIEVRGG
tara:strand:- start:2764 stop:3222 length:459 start_codon:yes stop_codon:yes gene_type:complete